MNLSRPGLIQLVAALVLSACGGGGAGGAGLPLEHEPLTPPEFQGGYRAFQIGANFASFGSGSASGAGLFGGTETRNVLGVLASGPLDADFTIDPDGTLVWSRAPFFDVGYGAMTVDGRFGAVQASGLRLLLESSGTPSTGSVQGTYRYVIFSVSVSNLSTTTLGTMTLDGLGGVLATLETANVEGVVSTGLGDTTGVYAVAADGEVTMDFGPLALVGGVGLDGELIVLAGGTNPTEGSALALLVKEQPGTAHAGLLSGRYEVVGHAFDPSPLFPLSELRGELKADGSGAAALRIDVSLIPGSAGRGCASPVPGSYGLSATGQLDLAVSGEQWRGAITASGEVAILGGGVATDNLTTAIVLIRKRDAADGSFRLDACDSGSVVEEPDPGGVLGTVRRRIQPLTTERRIEVKRGPLLGLSVAHGFLRFDLSALAPGTTIASATLVTTQDDGDGAPFATGSVVIDHVALGDGLDTDDFDSAPLPAGDGFATLSSTAALGERTADVTAAVQADLTDGRTTADFRLRLLGTELSSSSVTFDDHTGIGPSTGSRTRLVIMLP